MTVILTVRVSDAAGNETVQTHTFSDGPDRTAFLQSFIDAAPDGTGQNPSEVKLPSGTFRVDGRLLISDREWLVVDASGCVMVRSVIGERNSDHIRIEGSRHIRWLGGRVQGFHTGYDEQGVHGLFDADLEAQHGISIRPLGSTSDFFRDTVDIVIDGFECRDVAGDFVYVAGTHYGPQSARVRIEPSNVTIRRLLGEKNGRQGVGVNGVVGLVVEDSTIIAKRTGVDLENVLSGSIDNVVVRRNAIRTRNGVVNGQSSNAKCNNVVVEKNAVYGPGMRSTGKALQHRRNWQLVGNVWPGPAVYVKDVTNELFWFYYVDDVVVADNYFRVGLKSVHDRNQNAALRLCGVDGIWVTGNDFRGENQLYRTPVDCVEPVNIVAVDNVGIWEGPIPTHAPYPAEHDPNVDRAWFPSDFPALYPTPYATVGHWDSLLRGSKLGG